MAVCRSCVAPDGLAEVAGMPRAFGRTARYSSGVIVGAAIRRMANDSVVASVIVDPLRSFG